MIRSSIDDFFNSLEWSNVHELWRRCLTGDDEMPAFVRGEGEYGFTDLQVLLRARQQAHPRAPLHASKGRVKSLFVLRVGYDGAAYHGFQRQGHGQGAEEVRTVECELSAALGCSVVAAGRTDKVSGVESAVALLDDRVLLPVSAG
jgi:hypothetical protein